MPRGVYERTKRTPEKKETAAEKGEPAVKQYFRPKKRVYIGPDGVTVQYR